MLHRQSFSRRIFIVFVVHYSIFSAVISNISTERVDISRQIVDVQQRLPTLRRVRQMSSQHYHHHHQQGLFDLRNHQNDYADSSQELIELELQLVKYENEKHELPDKQTCTCPEPKDKICPYLINIASPCFFSFTIIFNTARTIYYESTDFLPVHQSINKSSAIDFGKKLQFSGLQALPTSIDVFVYQLGPAINQSTLQAIYVDHLSLVDHFQFTIGEQSLGDGDSKDLSRPQKRTTEINGRGDVIGTRLSMIATFGCSNGNAYGPHCEMRCTEQVKNNSLIPYNDSENSLVCRSILEQELNYYCTKDTNSNLTGSLTNCQQCIFIYNDATCSTICVPINLLRQPNEITNDNSNWWYYIFFLVFLILFLLAMTTVALLLIHITRERRRNQVYGDKENFFSAIGNGDGGSSVDGLGKQAGRHFTIDHELPPNAVKRGLSPPRSPFYDTSSGSTVSERISKNGAPNGGVLCSAPLSVDYGYTASPDRREALV